MLHLNGNTLSVSIYIDDLVIVENNLDLILGLKRQLATTSEIIDLGLLHYFLDLQVFPMSNGISISYSIYSLDILKHFMMDDGKP